MKTILLVNESVSFHVIASKPSVVTRYCYINRLASFHCCSLVLFSLYNLYIYIYYYIYMYKTTSIHIFTLSNSKVRAETNL